MSKALSSCAISFQDKNRNSGYIACGFLFWRQTYAEYVENYQSYKLIPNVSENMSIERWVKWYEENLRCSIRCIRKIGTLHSFLNR